MQELGTRRCNIQYWRETVSLLRYAVMASVRLREHFTSTTLTRCARTKKLQIHRHTRAFTQVDKSRLPQDQKPLHPLP